MKKLEKRLNKVFNKLIPNSTHLKIGSWKKVGEKYLVRTAEGYKSASTLEEVNKIIKSL
jgi:hypothetical protein